MAAEVRCHRAQDQGAVGKTQDAADRGPRHHDHLRRWSVLGTYKHLKHNLGFHEVGFAPVTTSPNRLYSISVRHEQRAGPVSGASRGIPGIQLRGEHHGFSNVSDTLAELHQGVNKSLPCGAGLGLLGVGPSGDIAPCHRFVDSDAHISGQRDHGHRQREAVRVPEAGQYRQQIRLPYLLGQASLCRRLPSRSLCPLRGYGAPKPALLRLDPLLDGHLPAHLRNHCSGEPRISRPLF